jgi:hypothetical protein
MSKNEAPLEDYMRVVAGFATSGAAAAPTPEAVVAPETLDPYLGKSRQEQLATASRTGDLAKVKELHAGGIDVLNKEIEAMYLAVNNGHLDIVRYLHQKGADLTEQEIYYAASCGFLDILTYVHQNGVDLTGKIAGQAMQSAVKHDHPDVLKYIYQNSRDVTEEDWGGVLRKAEGYRHFAILDYLDQNGVDLKQTRPLLAGYKTRCALWRKTVRMDPPHGLHDADPRFFKKSVIDFILPILEYEGYKSEHAYRMAFNAAGLFQSKDRVLHYLQKWGSAGKQPLHDVIHMIYLPKDGNASMKDWGDAALKFGPDMARLVCFANKIDSPCKSSDGKTWSLAATCSACAKFAFNRAAEHPSLAQLCVTHFVGEEIFEKALRLVQKGAPQTKNIPDLVIDGAAFGMAGAKFYRLAPDDIRGLFLGKLTDCCQSIGCAGGACAEYGYESPDGGFYVLENAKGEVIGQTFAWRGVDGGLCFDTLETLGTRVTPDQWRKVLKCVAEELTARKDHDVERLTVGLGGDTPKELTAAFEKAATPVEPLNYIGYSEAGEQVIIFQAKKPGAGGLRTA